MRRRASPATHSELKVTEKTPLSFLYFQSSRSTFKLDDEEKCGSEIKENEAQSALFRHLNVEKRSKKWPFAAFPGNKSEARKKN